MNIVLFDGVCNFCNSTVIRIIKYDTDNRLQFAAQQSEAGKKIVKSFNIDTNDRDTIYFIKNDTTLYKETKALIEIVKLLKGKSRLLLVIVVIPAPIRDFFYRLFAKNRYRLFGRRKDCMIPSDEISNRFLDVGY